MFKIYGNNNLDKLIREFKMALVAFEPKYFELTNIGNKFVTQLVLESENVICNICMKDADGDYKMELTDINFFLRRKIFFLETETELLADEIHKRISMYQDGIIEIIEDEDDDF